MQLEAGARVDSRYVVHSLLGKGGMAHVYGARDERLGIDVALKVLTVPSASIRDRLVQEGRVQAGLQHPNVLNVTDIVDVGGSPGLVMPLVRGPSLDRLLAGHALDRVEAEHLFRGIVAGVRRAHELDLVHRDLKPGNVMVERIGDQLVPRVADFGLAKLLADDSESGTRSGLAMGTPRYMSPEQIRDAKHVDARADLFSLGAILYELLCGRAAFHGEDTLQLFNAIAEGRWLRPDTLGLELPDRLQRAVDRCLTPDRDARIESCEALIALLDEDEGPPRERWRRETLEAVDDLAAPPPAGLGELGSSETWTGSEAPALPSSSETMDDFAASVEAPARPEPTDVPAAPVPPSRRAGWLVLALGVLAIVGLGWWSTRPPAVFTPEAPPPIQDSPDIERLLDSAWFEFRANEDVGALKHIEQAVEAGATDPAVFVLGVALSYGAHHTTDRFLDAGVEANPSPTTPSGELLHALHEVAGEGEQVWAATLGAHLDRYPQDHLALALGALVATTNAHPDARARATAFLEADPTAPLGHIVMMQVLNRADEHDAALRMAERGLQSNPDNAALHSSRAYELTALGRYEDAIEAARASLRADPRWYPGRTAGVEAALMAGQPEAAEELAQPMLADEVDPRMLQEFGSRYASALYRAGRIRDAQTWWDHAGRAAERSSELRTEVNRRARVAQLFRAPWLADTDRLTEAVAALDRLLASAELSSAHRRWPALQSRLAHAVLDVRAGRDPETIDSEEVGVDGVLLQAEIDRANRNWSALAARHADCRVALWRALFALDAGELDPADAHLEQARSEDTCTRDPALEAAVHGGLARLATARGDHAEAKAQLDALAEVWPRPDADVPLIQTLAREVSPEVLPPGALNAWLADRQRPLIVGLVPIEPVGVEPSVAQGVDMGLQALLDGQPNARAVAVTGPDDPAAARVDAVITGRVAAIGTSVLLRLDRTDAGGSPGGALLYQADDATTMGEHLEGALVVVLQDSLARRNREAIGTTMARYRPAVRACYEAAASKKPTLGGRIELAWTIEPGGIPTGVTVVEDTVGDAGMADCLVQEVSELVFPPGTQGTVHYPFILEPAQ